MGFCIRCAIKVVFSEKCRINYAFPDNFSAVALTIIRSCNVYGVLCRLPPESSARSRFGTLYFSPLDISSDFAMIDREVETSS